MRAKAPVIIRRVEIRECREKARFRGTFTSGGMAPEENVWLFTAVSDGEVTGFGECIPTSLFFPPGHIGRSETDEWNELIRLARSMAGSDALKLGRLIEDDSSGEDANSIKDALDFAVHDLVGRRLGVPVAALLGGIARPFVQGMPVIFRDSPDNMAERAAYYREKFGFSYFKLKPAGTREEDIEILTKMRERMGPGVRYYADANYRLKISEISEIAEYINALHALGLEVYEDPVRADLKTYRDLCELTKPRIMIDERARTLEDVKRIMLEGAADQINIHANWAGGFWSAIRKAQAAALGGIPTMVGSVGYLGPGAAAYQTLASVLSGLPCEQCFNDVVGRGPVAGKPYLLREGKYFIPAAPGLGFEPDMEIIESLTVRKEIVG